MSIDAAGLSCRINGRWEEGVGFWSADRPAYGNRDFGDFCFEAACLFDCPPQADITLWEIACLFYRPPPGRKGCLGGRKGRPAAAQGCNGACEAVRP